VGGVSFNIATTTIRANGNAALPVKDYAAWQQLGKTIAQGQSSATFSVKVMGDKITERNEVFGVRLSNAVGAIIGNGLGVGTIINDDNSHLLGNENNSVTATSGNSALIGRSSTQCERLQKEVTKEEAKVAANSMKETEGVRNILQLETQRTKIGCR
jgi:hypothetical protein